MNRIGLLATMIAFALSAPLASGDDEIGRLILNDGMPQQAQLAARPLAPEIMSAGEVVATDQVGDLERALEGQVREVVSGIVTNGRFAAYVHVTLTNDGSRLRAYQQEMELASLPGLPAPDPVSGRAPMSGRLAKLIKSKKITLVLDEDVAEEQEAIVQDVLRSKLMIREAAGDILMVRRSKLPPAPATTGAEGALQGAAYGFVAPSIGGMSGNISLALAFVGIALLAALGAIIWQLAHYTRRDNGERRVTEILSSMPASAIAAAANATGVAQPSGIEAVAIPDRLLSAQPGDPDSVLTLFGGLHAEVEDRLLGLIAAEDIESSEALQNHFFGFHRVRDIPIEHLREALAGAAPEWIAAAIATTDDDTSELVLDALEPRFRDRVLKRLQSEEATAANAPRGRSEAAKRVLLALIRKQLDQAGVRISDLNASTAEEKEGDSHASA